MGRVNYILRAIQVKPGKHTVVLSFYPKSVSATETIAYVAMAVLVILLIAAIVYESKKRKKA